MNLHPKRAECRTCQHYSDSFSENSTTDFPGRRPQPEFTTDGTDDTDGRESTLILSVQSVQSVGAPVKLVTSWVKVPPVELDGSRPKRGVRDEAAKPNHKRDAERNCRVVTKVNLI